MAVTASRPSPHSTSPAIGARGHVIPGGAIQVSSTPVCIGSPVFPEGTSGPPQVELLDGGRQIRVRCRCGETILIDCEFPDPS